MDPGPGSAAGSDTGLALSPANEAAQSWINILAQLQRSPRTLEAYEVNVEDFFCFAARSEFSVIDASRLNIAQYVADLARRPRPRSRRREVGLSNATIHQRLTTIRLFYDYLIEEGLRSTNPVGRGRYSAAARDRVRGLVPRYSGLPWIPNDNDWARLVSVASAEPLRNRVMFSFAYECGLRREELCLLEIRDIDFASRCLSIRAETTKTRRGRTVPFSATSTLLRPFLVERRQRLSTPGRLFLSHSVRNENKPISVHTWTKVIESIARRADNPRFTTHTFRHMCLTDLARAGWDIAEIAAFAGHRNTNSTLLYIHMSGRDLAEQYARTMQAIHAQRAALLAEVFR